ncbi:MAG: flagellar biosynthetic protein FliO [Bacteroidetes bacterium]|nr:flagellar biosynthetic protein FliO [Bacteroidota bacterium]MCL5738249.1 flagellar biosynthetic protein FliO [Bacteroidota bacterium]
MDWLIVKTFLTMILIVGLMFALLIVARKYFYGKPHFVNENMKVLAAMNLQPKKAIYLVKVFNKALLVGVSDNAIASLGEITDSEVLQKLDAAGEKRRGKGFAEILKGFSQR